MKSVTALPLNSFTFGLWLPDSGTRHHMRRRWQHCIVCLPPWCMS